MKQSELIRTLKAQTIDLIEKAEAFKTLPSEKLNFKSSPESWSVLQCIEHLNLYGDFYLPEVEKRILKAKTISHDPDFKSGWFGERTVSGMLPKENRIANKMNTFKSKNPDASTLTVAVIDRFLRQQKRWLELLDQAQKVHMSKVKTNITLPLIKFKLGTTLRFVVNHHIRHFWQAQNVLNGLQ